jgi:hypothetical protein
MSTPGKHRRTQKQHSRKVPFVHLKPPGLLYFSEKVGTWAPVSEISHFPLPLTVLDFQISKIFSLAG